jgi:alginate O-acetyltransferase complex protein AlgI
MDSLNNICNYLASMFNFKNIIVDKMFIYYFIPNISLITFSIIASTPIIKTILDKYKYIRIIVLVFGLILCTSFLVDESFNPFLYFRF